MDVLLMKGKNLPVLQQRTQSNKVIALTAKIKIITKL